MTNQTRDRLHKLVRYANLAGIVVLILTIGSWKKEMEMRGFDSQEQKQTTISHAQKGSDSYDNVHMPRSTKDQTYVTKTELDNMKDDIEEIKDSQIEIRKDIKEILKRK